MTDKTVGLLAVVAVIAVIGVAFSASQVIRSARFRRQADDALRSMPAPSDSVIKNEVTSGPYKDFWDLFQGDSPSARLLKKGGRLRTRADQRVTVTHVTDTLTVVVVAQTRDAEEVWRYVCSRDGDGIVAKNEPRRFPAQPDNNGAQIPLTRRVDNRHIDDVQACNTNRHGMRTVHDPEIKELSALLGECYRTSAL